LAAAPIGVGSCEAYTPKIGGMNRPWRPSATSSRARRTEKPAPALQSVTPTAESLPVSVLSAMRRRRTSPKTRKNRAGRTSTPDEVSNTERPPRIERRRTSAVSATARSGLAASRALASSGARPSETRVATSSDQRLAR
jgi:hypothetical protein